jgi:hypothetical protein
MSVFRDNPNRIASSASAAGSWLHFFVGPRRYLAVLPSNVRPNLFAGD